MESRIRKHMDHQSPEWVRSDADYFITVCANQRQKNHFCNPQIGPVLLESIHFRHVKGNWFCHLAVLMPDHIHLLISFPDVPVFAKIVGDWKHWLSRKHGILWQENFFEHRLRNEESIEQKANYILQNPVRAGLVLEAKAWPYVWMPSSA